MYVCMCKYIRTYEQRYMYMHVYVCTCTCMYVYVPAYLCSNVESSVSAASFGVDVSGGVSQQSERQLGLVLPLAAHDGV